MKRYLLAVDQGTTSTRAIVFTLAGQLVGQFQLELPQYYPQNGWVEHDIEQIWQQTVAVIKGVLAQCHLSAQQIKAIGITNQRETSIIWDKVSGQPLSRAIVWQDRRTYEFCQKLIMQGLEADIRDRTGLLLDPYFSATKIKWLLDHHPGAREKAQKGLLLFGTVETYLLWQFTRGKSHYTDITNASRTLLYNIHQQCWDDKLLEIFQVPRAMLPTVRDNCFDFGEVDKTILGYPIPISAMIGDQQAALIGQACLFPGMLKSTYGTGCFILLNTGQDMIQSQHRLLTTVAYRIDNKICYGLEGSIFIAGAAVQWLRDALKLISSASESENIASNISSNEGVYLVPAFTGLGAPYWDPSARAAILGLTRDSGVAHIIRAALEAVCYQSQDLLLAMLKDGATVDVLRVDGGMVVNNWLMQFLADIVHKPVERATVIETSALGVAYLAGLQQGVFSSINEIAALWRLEQDFLPMMSSHQSQKLYSGWIDAVARVSNNHNE